MRAVRSDRSASFIREVTPMKVSEITECAIAKYLRLGRGEYDESQLTMMLDAAKAFVKSYTGLGDDEIDEHEDIAIVILVLCQDMYDNRTLYVDKNNLNRVVDTILGMHSVNLLPTPPEE
jgi:hypothetical protein